MKMRWNIPVLLLFSLFAPVVLAQNMQAKNPVIHERNN